ncbi:hypothetical protein GCM10022402_02720 [Salinactinospora qingdaonensis]|uniref:Heparan-alpha-glucosaminide N-acetyltransferase catalytic domain-containing protein n=1 Tax=Salinactinospora qingdaonensis TaxID=702744 RepID=A0ABP7F095_9ACTN
MEDAVPAGARIVGIDVARALAVFGMFTVHLGVGAIGLLPDDPAEIVHGIARGRSSALFAFLAGVSLALVSGRSQPLAGQPLHRLRLRLLVRATILIVLGALLDVLGTRVAVILAYYGGYFVLALPLLRLRAPALAATAAAIWLVGPQASFVLRGLLGTSDYPQSSVDGPLDFLLTGYYPAFTFMAFVVAGMAVGRLDLSAGRVRAWLAGVGLGLVTLGYGGSWLALHPLGGLERLTHALSPAAAAGQAQTDLAYQQMVREWVSEQIGSLHGRVPTDTPLWLLVASPHSGTSFEIAGAVGAALLVLVACLVAADFLGAVCYPLAAAGAMALTVYVGHIVVIALIGAAPEDTAPFRLELFLVGALAFATLWRLLLGRGPLERGVSWASTVAADAAAPPDQPRR